MICLTFGMNPLKTKWLPQPFKKNGRLKSLWARFRCSECIQIWYGCSLGISDDLINFWDESIKKTWMPQPLKKIDMVVVGVIFSHYFLILMDRAYG